MGTGGSHNRMKAETLRKRDYRERVRTAQALGLAPRADPPVKTMRRPTVVPGQDMGQGLGQDENPGKPEQQLIRGLQALAGDESASGQARVSAARAVLEVQGVLGRHATGQRDKEASLPASLLSRDGLVRELSRLRRSILPGTRSQPIDIIEADKP